MGRRELGSKSESAVMSASTAESSAAALDALPLIPRRYFTTCLAPCSTFPFRYKHESDEEWSEWSSECGFTGDQYVYRHGNGLCVVGVMPSHDVFNGRSVVRVDFSCGSVNLLDNAVRGKRKRGGITLRPRTPICNVHCDDGMQFQLLACVSGQLLEANERLAANPAMMNEAAGGDAFCVIISPFKEGRPNGLVPLSQSDVHSVPLPDTT